MSQRSNDLAYPVYRRLLDVERSPVFEIVYFVQILSGYVICTISVAVCSIIAILVMHASGQLEIVMCLCQGLLKDHEDRSKNNRMVNAMELRARVGELVEHHLRVLRWIIPDFDFTTEENELILIWKDKRNLWVTNVTAILLAIPYQNGANQFIILDVLSLKI